MITRLSQFAVSILIGIAFIILFLACAMSLNWPYLHDSPLMIYAGWLIAHGAIPYRDFFDMNMPGTYFVMWAMGMAFGWNDFGFRVFDLLCLASIAISTFFWMWRFGILPALVASVAFPLWYLANGPIMSMQREYIALVPFCWLMAIANAGPRFNPTLQTIAVGLLTAATLLIKPQFLLPCFPVLTIILQGGINTVSLGRRAAALVIGTSAPLAATFLYLLWTESLTPFLDIAINYWPLYTHMTGGHMPISGFNRLVYLVKSTGAGLVGLNLPLAIVGLTVLRRDHRQRRYAWVLGGLLAAAAIYPATAGQFWSYHWLPFYYVALCVASLSFRVLPLETWRNGNIAYMVPIIFLTFFLSKFAVITLHPWKGNLDVPYEIHSFLCSHIKTGDTVQPLDWTAGAVHGMLRAKAPLATRFMYDFHFYHHINSRYIQELRREFMNELSAKKPRFIIEVIQSKPWPNGPNTTREFPELKSFLEKNYGTIQTAKTYRILERMQEMPNK